MDGSIARAAAVATVGEETVALVSVPWRGGPSCHLGWHVLVSCCQVSPGSSVSYSKPDSSGSLSLVYEVIPLSLWNIPLLPLELFFALNTALSSIEVVTLSFFLREYDRNNHCLYCDEGTCICWKFPCLILKICTTQFTSTIMVIRLQKWYELAFSNILEHTKRSTVRITE